MGRLSLKINIKVHIFLCIRYRRYLKCDESVKSGEYLENIIHVETGIQ